MTHPELQAIIRGIAPAIRDHVREQVRQYAEDDIAKAIVGGIRAALAPIETRLADLEATRPTAWKSAQMYSTGELVSHDGNVWRCNHPTYSRPGTDDCYTRVQR